MVSFSQRALFWFFFCCLFMSGAVAQADKVFLVDGTVQESDKVWLSPDYVHFILRDSQGVEIRYAKEIVARVQINGVEKSIHLPPTQSESSLQEKKTPRNNNTLKELDKKISSPLNNPSSPSQINTVDRSIIQTHKGMEFYAPRRSQRYWAASNSKHTTLDSALSALAQIYERNVGWVERHMGVENDLGAIHRNLISQHDHESGFTDATKAAPQPVAVPSSIQAADNGSESVGPAAAPVTNGLEFYNPRRKEKYWTGNEGRYNTIDDAMRALAQQYGVTTEWVDRHMGNTNDLTKIHQNIKNSLQAISK